MADRELETDLAARIVSICQAFEAACQRGEPPSLDAFAEQAAPEDREALRLELARIETAYRQRQASTDSHSLSSTVPGMPDDRLEVFSDQYKTISTPPGTASASSVCLPAAFGQYQVSNVLGEGSFGVVYRGRDPDLDRDVAIKVPRRERLVSLGDIQSFLSEARLLASLKHPGIVPVYYFGRTDDGLCYVVSQLISGGDLATLMKRKRVTHGEAVEILTRIAEALGYAHQHGLVHRDIKPGNILIDEQGQPLLADFGLALIDDQYGEKSGIYGTPAYMSPEQASGDGHIVDARSDIYSLGVIFYELLTGRRPYRRKEMRGLLDEIASGETRPPRQLDHRIPPELERICLKAMAKHPADRYTTAFDLAAELRRWQPGESAFENQRGVPREHAGSRRWPRNMVLATIAIVAMAWTGNAALKRKWAPDNAVDQHASANNEQSMPTQAATIIRKDQATPSSAPVVAPVEDGGTGAIAATPDPVPLQVRSIDVEHFARTSTTEAEPRGILGKQSFVPRLGDQVTIEARLSRPAYAYLVAFRPDGVVEVCFPDSESEPPPLTDRLRYPAAGQADTRYGLSEGTGLWAFAVLASETPLPAFHDFVAEHKPDWTPRPENPGTIWWFDGQWIEHLAGPTGPSGVRGKGEVALGGSKAVERAAHSLRADPAHEATAAIGFGVGP